MLERFLGIAVGNILDEFLARSLRRRAGYAGVPWPLSEATPALFSHGSSPSDKSQHPVEKRRHHSFLISISNFNFQSRSFSCPLFYFLFGRWLGRGGKEGRSFPAASIASARGRPLSSPALKRPSRQSQRRKSSARRSPFCELHSPHDDTRLR